MVLLKKKNKEKGFFLQEFDFRRGVPHSRVVSREVTNISSRSSSCCSSSSDQSSSASPNRVNTGQQKKNRIPVGESLGHDDRRIIIREQAEGKWCR